MILLNMNSLTTSDYELIVDLVGLLTPEQLNLVADVIKNMVK